jgi:hypothetical protein
MDEDLDVVDRGLARLFAEDQPVPPAFTVQMLRRVAEEGWRREMRLARILHAGLGISGVLVIAGIGYVSATFPTLSAANAAIAILLVMLIPGSLVAAAFRFKVS